MNEYEINYLSNLFTMKKNITFLILLFFAIGSMQGQILIGNGTAAQKHVPFDPNYAYSYVQTIYLASEINASGNITSLKWYYDGSSNLANSQGLNIYLGHTTKSAFLNETDWEPINGLQLAYTGGIVAAAPGWVTINLTTPFAYNGTDNLVVAVSETQPGKDNALAYFYSRQVSGKRSLSFYNNTVVPDLAAPANANVASRYIPNIVLGGIALACETPLFVTIPAFTSSTATITWDAPTGTPSGGSQYYISESDSTPANSQEATAGIPSGNTAVATGLLPATTYYVWVRNVCDGTAGNWSYPTSLMTACTAQQTITENFDDFSNSGPLPTCWSSIIRGDGVSANIGVAPFGSYSGQNSVLMANNDSSAASDIILVTPELSTLSSGTYRLKFFADGDALNSLEIGTLNNNTQSAQFSPLASVETTNNYAEYTVSFAAYTGTDRYVGIRLNSINQYNPIYLDNIRWELAPLCPDVTQVVVAPVTPDTATVSWIANGITEWQLAYGPDSATDPEALTLETINNTPVKMITGLAPNTPYKVWIRTVCGTNPGFWTGPVLFRSACTPVNTFNESFDDVQPSDLPSCWSKILRGNTLSENAGIGTTSNNQHSGVNSVLLTAGASNTTLGDDIILVSPNLENFSTTPHRVKFYAKGDAQFEVGTMTGNNGSATFTNLQGVQATDVLTEYTLDFSTYTGNNTYIGFRISSTEFNTSVYLDDIRWEVTPLCPDVTEITVPAVTVNSATINWVPGDSETAWNVVYGDPSVTNPDTLVPFTADSTSLELNGLAPNTIYNVWVRSACGTSNGVWIGPVSLTTACTPVAEFDENFDAVTNQMLPGCWSKILRGATISENAVVNLAGYNSYSGVNSIEMGNNNSTGDFDVILVTPSLSNTGAGTNRLKFYAYSPDIATIQVGTLSSNTSQAEFHIVQSMATTTDYFQYVIDFPSSENGDNYIGIRLEGVPNIALFVDNVVWETIPLCPDVINLNTLGTTTTTATVTWESDGSANSWQVVYGDVTATNPDALTAQAPVETTTATIADLSPATSYKYWVRTVCGGANGNGAWIGPVEFKTQCVAVTGLDENFDTTSGQQLPDCWSSILRGPNLSSDARVKVISSHAVSGQRALIIDNDNSNITDDIILVSPAIVNLSTGAYVLTFKADGDDPTSFQIVTLDGNTNNANYTLFQELVTTNDYATYTVDLSTYIGTDSYIGIRHNDPGNFTPIYIDDIVLQSTLSTGDFDDKSFTYYPNPVKNILNLSYTKNITNVTVYNLLGQSVLDNKNDATSSIVDMSHLPTGTYIVKVMADNQVKTIKVMKE